VHAARRRRGSGRRTALSSCQRCDRVKRLLRSFGCFSTLTRLTSMPSFMYLAQSSSLGTRVSSYVAMSMNTYCECRTQRSVCTALGVTAHRGSCSGSRAEATPTVWRHKTFADHLLNSIQLVTSCQLLLRYRCLTQPTTVAS